MDIVVSSPADEDLLVELLNTTPIVDGVAVDLLDGSWVAGRAGGGVVEGGPGAVGGGVEPEASVLRELRVALQSVVRGDADPSSLNGRLRSLAVFPQVLLNGGIDWAGGQAPAPLDVHVLLGWVSAAGAHPGRLRACGNDECNLFLLDRSRSGTAKWCSMATCGNRLKARRFSARA